jgi:hypothetical protein
MYGLALCLPSVGQPQGLPVPHEIPKTRFWFVVTALAGWRWTAKTATTNLLFKVQNGTSND